MRCRSCFFGIQDSPWSGLSRVWIDLRRTTRGFKISVNTTVMRPGLHMRKNNNIIEINGHRYDVKTGERLSVGGSSRHTASAMPTVHASPHEAPPKPRTVARQPAHHHKSHPPATSRTLMRQGVKKPALARQHRLRAQGHTDALVQTALPPVTPQQSVLQLDEKRWQHAKHVPKSRLISRFSPATAATNNYVTPRPASHPPQTQHQPSQPPSHTKPTEKLLEQALAHATSYQELPTTKRRHLLHRRRHARAGL
jgi:hypothetical protein